MGVPASLSQVPNVAPYRQYVATGGQTVYPYPFPITEDLDLVVVINAVTQSTDSTYSVSGVGNSAGGNVTLNSGSTAGDVVTLYRNIPIQRISQIAQNSGFASQVFNNEYNNFYLIAQQLQAAIAQCLQIPNTNSPAPVTTLAASAWAGKYMSFDANGNPQPALLTPTGTLTSVILAGLLSAYTATAVLPANVRTLQEANAGVTPVNYAYLPGDIRRYGAVLDGITDDTTAVTNWAKCGGMLSWPVPQTALTSAAVPVPSNTSIYAVDGASIKGGANQSLLTGTNSTQVSIRGLSFTQASCGSSPYVAGIALTDSSAWLIDDCEFFGLQWAGVWCLRSPRNTIRASQFHDFSGPTAATFTGTVTVSALAISGVSGAVAIGQIVANAATGAVIGPIVSGSGTSWVLGNTPSGSISGVALKSYTPVSDSADVVLYDSSSDNNIVDNPMMKSWAHHGVLCQDPYTVPSNPPRNNLIDGNDISDHIDYGVAVYVPSVSGSFTGSISTTTFSVPGAVIGSIAIGMFLVNGTSGVVYGQITGGSGTSWTISASAGTVTSQLLYAVTPQDTDNRVNNNKISNIQGCGANVSAGTGVYVVGAGAGGTQVNSNRIKNCCISTSQASLAPAAIGIAGQNFAGIGITPVQASSNQISGMSQGDGIRIVGCGNGAVITGNNAQIPASNAGTGLGGSSLIGHCYNILASGLISFTGNLGQNYGSGSGINVNASGVACTDINIVGGRMETATGITLGVVGTSSFNVSNLKITGFHGKNNSTTGGISLTWVAGGSINGASMSCIGPSSNGGVALSLANCTVVLAATGGMRSNGAVDVQLTGTCTGSFIDKSINTQGAGHITNASTGGIVHQFSTAAPGSGTQAVGDTFTNSAPTTGGVSQWNTTVAGNPGTFKTISNT